MSKKKFGILSFIFMAFMMLIPGGLQARVQVGVAVYPKGYYYRSGRWMPYRGLGHPYRGGYYDRRGRWHRVG